MNLDNWQLVNTKHCNSNSCSDEQNKENKYQDEHWFIWALGIHCCQNVYLLFDMLCSVHTHILSAFRPAHAALSHFVFQVARTLRQDKKTSSEYLPSENFPVSMIRRTRAKRLGSEWVESAASNERQRYTDWRTSEQNETAFHTIKSN